MRAFLSMMRGPIFLSVGGTMKSGRFVNSLRTCHCEGVKLKHRVHGNEQRSSVSSLSKLSKVNSKFDGACGGCHLEGTCNRGVRSSLFLPLFVVASRLKQQRGCTSLRKHCMEASMSWNGRGASMQCLSPRPSNAAVPGGGFAAAHKL